VISVKPLLVACPDVQRRSGVARDELGTVISVEIAGHDADKRGSAAERGSSAGGGEPDVEERWFQVVDGHAVADAVTIQIRQNRFCGANRGATEPHHRTRKNERSSDGG
jgi:hypothetical protein